jgi:hypothetical protein
MLTDNDIIYLWNTDSPDERGSALAFIIDQDVVYDAPFYNWAADMFLRADSFVEITQENLVDKIIISILENNVEIEQLETSEYFGSILLSGPTIKDLNSYAYGRYVVAPNAKFINNEFVILDGNVSHLPPFWTEEEIAQSKLRHELINND